MSAKVSSIRGNEQRQIRSTIEEAIGDIRRTLQKPIYLRIEASESGALTIRQVEYLTVEGFADLCHVDERTVYTWIEKAKENGLRFYRPPGTRRPLFDMADVDEWVRSNPNLEDA